MNSTTSPDHVLPPLTVGQTVYVPFWSLLEFLDSTPPDPFVKCRVTALYERNLNSPAGQVVVSCCNLEIKPGLTADGMPVEYLVPEAELPNWMQKIADWFLSYKP